MKALQVGPFVGILVMVATAIAVVAASPYLRVFYDGCDEYGKGMISGFAVGVFAMLLLRQNRKRDE